MFTLYVAKGKNRILSEAHIVYMHKYTQVKVQPEIIHCKHLPMLWATCTKEDTCWLTITREHVWRNRPNCHVCMSNRNGFPAGLATVGCNHQRGYISIEYNCKLNLVTNTCPNHRCYIYSANLQLIYQPLYLCVVHNICTRVL